jgi:prepilin peptidase CpaA
MPPEAAIWTALIVAGMAGIWDWRERRIPNWLCLAGFCAALVFTPWKLLMQGAGLGLLIHLPFYALRFTGGGDLKLMTVLGALLGPTAWLQFFLINAVFGGLAALGVLVWSRRAKETFARVGSLLVSLLRLRTPHRDLPTLDIQHAQAHTMPRGTVAAIAMLIWVLVIVKL